MQNRTFVGFGFGAIQGGLFLYEASRSGNFDRLVVAEVVPDVVAALDQTEGRYHVNIATRKGLLVREVAGLEVYNPNDPEGRRALVEAIAEADEIATALPSVDFFDVGEASVAGILAEGISRRLQEWAAPPCVVYTAENNNHAAEILEEIVVTKLSTADAARVGESVQFLNTVIGKMSRVVTDAAEIAAVQLAPIVPGFPRALLVEEFNRILVSQIKLPRFERGITVFEEKADLLPFEEAKLYGHNAVHALIGYLARQQGCRFMSDAGQDKALMALAREAFLDESGAALIKRRQGVDDLFTPAGYAAYADDLLTRMVNPFLRDSIDRVTRDPRRKLDWADRLVGTMRLALDAGIAPRRFARGAAAALALIAQEEPRKTRDQLLDELWQVNDQPPGRKAELKRLILQTSG